MAAVAESLALDKAQALETRYRGVAPALTAMRAGLQHGFVIPFQLLAGIVAIALVAGIVHSYNEGQQAKAKLETCQTQYQILLGEVQKQNAAVQAYETAIAKAQERAAKARKGAEQAIAMSKSELDRLAGLATKGGTCVDAVQQVRQGLSAK